MLRSTRTLVALVAVLIGCQRESEGEHVGTLASPLLAVPESVWKDPTHIPVCWESTGFATEKAWAKDAVVQSWEAATTGVRFVGWETCTASSRGIRIVVTEGSSGGGGLTTELGEALDGLRNGMELDFDFSSGEIPACTTSETMRERCIRAITAHEFGHALGFRHEQDRTDTPTSCPLRDPAEDSTTERLGAWDLMSIMNYCYPNRQSVFPTTLSPGDIAGLRQLYPNAAPPPVPPPAGESPPGNDSSPEPRPSTPPNGAETPGTPKRSSAEELPAGSASSGCDAAPGAPSGGAGAALLLAAALGSRRRHSLRTSLGRSGTR